MERRETHRELNVEKMRRMKAPRRCFVSHIANQMKNVYEKYTKVINHQVLDVHRRTEDGYTAYFLRLGRRSMNTHGGIRKP